MNFVLQATNAQGLGMRLVLDRVALLPILSALVAAHCDSKESSKAAMNSCEF